MQTAAASAVIGQPSAVMVGMALNFKIEYVSRSKMWAVAESVLKPLRTSCRAVALVSSLMTWSKTTVMCRRTPCRISLIRPVAPAFLRAAFAEKMRAGREDGITAPSGRHAAMVLAQMPLTRHAGHFLGLGALGSGGGAVVKSDRETILRSVSLRAPGSSLDTRSKRVTAFWMWRLLCLAVGAVATRLGCLGWGI